ncbi:GNAT family N-acetyltransferase [Blastococcus sp. MG754426]|uniref:GNAT family N-acetyltransferase n=1 Tax=unclassified Blastococcus TaxID=2619396 RepID=UPI001EF0C48D|nr:MULTISPECIES: GNAT family N-acetyltransferase [unclassified Blastococcus]MCF6509197.1 GNAT family N-acetyltransferase [Blastococcus sp. MG754426]MCF6513765.1 GNAT family N-acetyltransferase [Blastococcus sp. MG754427]MCF6736323.1 GNAT family N-acetyltransferase [Blastococcus sp. KM273129]
MSVEEQVHGGGLLFGDPRFHDLNGVPEERRWCHEHRVDGRLVGVLPGVVADGVLLSGHSAPFGGPDLARPDPTVGDVVGFVDGVLARARAEGLEAVRIRCRPPEYSPAEPLLEYALLQAGFTVEHCDLNQVVDLAPLGPGGDPSTLLGKKRARDVRADLALPYELVDVADDEGIALCHGILAANRAAHGRPAGLPAEYLARARAAFPDRVRLHLLRYAERPVAAAVVYRVLDDVDLLVAWGDDGGHGLQRSPMNLLAHLLVERSLRTGARLLDLGPSSEKDGSPNFGLAHFKRSVGARPGTRKVLLATLP